MTIRLFYPCKSQFRHRDKSDVGCKPGDCRWLVNIPYGFCRYLDLYFLHTEFITFDDHGK